MEPAFIGRMVWYHRKRAGLSRDALAELSGVGRTSIFALEHGKATVRLDTLVAVLRTLNITVRWEGPLVAGFLEEEHARG
jgi:transcriptional regulator with XRE-family HTH domain